MYNTLRGSIAAAAAVLLALSAGSLRAQDAGRGAVPAPHDSNTLSKISKAVQYPVRKAGENASKTGQKASKAAQYPVRKGSENASVAAHETTGKNSVIRRRHKAANRVVTPKGTVLTMPQAKAQGAAH